MPTLDDLFAEREENKTRVNTNVNTNLIDDRKSVVAPESQQQERREAQPALSVSDDEYDLQAELEKRFDELFGSRK